MVSTPAGISVAGAPPMVTRSAKPGDERGMLAALDTAFAGWPRFEAGVAPLDHLRWQLEGYRQQENAHFVTEVDGCVAALDIAYVRRFKAGAREISAWVGTDAATHVDFQGRGVYSRLQQYRQDQASRSHDLMLSQTTNPIISHFYQQREGRIDWANRFTLLLKVLDAGRLARRPGNESTRLRRTVPVRRAAFGLLGLAGGARSALHRAPRRAWVLRRIQRFDLRFDAFWERAALGFDFIGERTSDFLNWRYADPRAGEHVVLAAEAAGEILGYAALKRNWERGAIMDLLTLPGDEDVADSLVAAAIEHFRAAGCSAVQFMTVASHPYSGVLARQGFFDLRRKEDFYCAAMRLDKRSLRFLEDPRASVHLTDGDMV